MPMMELEDILQSLKSGKVSVSKAEKLLSIYSIEKIEDFAKLDINRKQRTGIPEVVFAENKQLSEIKKIIIKILKKSNLVLLSRLTKKDYQEVIKFSKKYKFKTVTGKNSTSILIHKKNIKTRGKIAILAAGTSDIGVAEEARLMALAMNCDSILSYDIGIAGMHRMFPALKKIIDAQVDSIIVVAGMEGALASIVTSLVNIPVIGVPTSVGYGYGEKGIAALASMLQSCTLGLSVVNIDNGIGAGATAANISNQIHKKNSKR